MQGFSCKGLIDQLSSSYGDAYTERQVTHGAQQTNACQEARGNLWFKNILLGMICHMPDGVDYERRKALPEVWIRTHLRG